MRKKEREKKIQKTKKIERDFFTGTQKTKKQTNKKEYEKEVKKK